MGGDVLPGFLQDIGEPNVSDTLANLARNRDLDFRDLLGRERNREHRGTNLGTRWLSIPANHRASFDAVQAFVSENRVICGCAIAIPVAAPLATRASHFEHIRKIGVEIDRQGRLDRMARMIRNPNPLEAMAVP
jgi:hypothetical protein